MTKCVAIYIDGSNFYFKLKSLGINQLDFNFKNFCHYLSGNSLIIHNKYYIGSVRGDGTRKTLRAQAHQQKILMHLKLNGITYVLGYLLKSNGHFHEKGVDVKIAVDLLVNAYKLEIDKHILISSDTDLIPAIEEVLSIGNKVEYIGFVPSPSKALMTACTSSRIFNYDDLKSFTNVL